MGSAPRRPGLVEAVMARQRRSGGQPERGAQLEELGRGREAPEVGDRSDPDAIRALFGLSKKAFKRAVGHLLKHGAVTIDSRGLS